MKSAVSVVAVMAGAVAGVAASESKDVRKVVANVRKRARAASQESRANLVSPVKAVQKVDASVASPARSVLLVQKPVQMAARKAVRKVVASPARKVSHVVKVEASVAVVSAASAVIGASAPRATQLRMNWRWPTRPLWQRLPVWVMRSRGKSVPSTANVPRAAKVDASVVKQTG